MSLLPVNKNTLIYGSSDSGNTVHADDEILNDKMLEFGRRANLKPHLTGQGLRKKEIVGPGDIEGHKGKVI